MGVNGRPTRACALSTDSETAPCSDQPDDNNAAHVKAEAASAYFPRFMSFSCAKNITLIIPSWCVLLRRRALIQLNASTPALITFGLLRLPSEAVLGGHTAGSFFELSQWMRSWENYVFL
jgi:hypothetical protein